MKPHLYLQIASKLRTTILRGDYVLGQKIPSIRSLAENEKCNPATIQKAMKVLEEQNLVISCGNALKKTKNFCTFHETVDKPLIQLSLRSNVDYLKNVLYFIM